MKKLFANFGFPNQSSTDQSFIDFDTFPFQPSVVLSKVALRSSMTQVDMRGGDSRFILCMDPVGESLICSEHLGEKKWHVYECQDLAVLMIENLMAHLKSNG
jgi:hypothetical protein